MKRNLFVSVLAVLLLVGCADPAENVPKASVSTNSSASADAGTTAGDGAKAAAAATSNPGAGAKAYAITPENSKVEFTGSKVTGKHDGGFKQLAGEVHVVGNAVQHAKVTIQTDSLYSDNDRLTGHLKSPDFFDTAKYSTAVFETTAISGSGANATVTGKLTLHGETKQISFPANIEVKDEG